MPHITKQNASAIGTLGGKKSAKRRFKGMTKKQVSERMKELRAKGKQK
jgi:hypothetical protein